MSGGCGGVPSWQRGVAHADRSAATADQDPRGLGKGEEQLLHLLGVEAFGVAPFGEALFQAGGHDGEPGSVEGLADGGELGDDVFALLAVLQHADDGVELSSGTFEAVGDRSHGGRVELHCQFSSVGRLVRLSRAAFSRRVASSATVCNAVLPVRATMVWGSTASTIVVPSGAVRTTTLHGRSSPMDGSACSAAWASGGLQAPRMTSWGTATPSLVFRVARISISVRMPNPCALSASRTCSTV